MDDAMTLPLSPAGRKYGYLKSKPDHRDFGLSGVTVVKANALPPAMDLETFCGPVKDQGQLGACTAFAGSGNLEYLFRRFKVQQPVFSPLFLYYQERKLNGSLDEGDCGSDGRTSCAAMQSVGVCLEADDVYISAHFQTEPTAFQIAEAAIRKSGAYHSILNVQDMKSCIASDYPILVGFSVYSSFESPEIASTGIMPVPNVSKEQLLGGHEVLMIGYDDSKQAFKVRNSWGSGWGAAGNFWMPYEVAADKNIVQDAWMQHLGLPW
jgi:C1A family cysteine protease